MIRFFGQIMKLPMAAFVSGMEMLARTMREFQMNFESNVDAVSTGLAQTLNETTDGTGAARATLADRSGGIDGDVADITQPILDKEENQMGDQDLGGDDLKVVRYRIIFTKRDYEATLEKADEEVVDYPTDGGSLGGLKVAEFMEKLKEKRIKLPPEWRGKDYPQRNAPVKGWEIPREDRRYIMFLYEVIRRVERKEAEYSKDKVHVLRQIRDAIDERTGR